jgi:hypothetical protein
VVAITVGVTRTITATVILLLLLSSRTKAAPVDTEDQSSAVKEAAPVDATGDSAAKPADEGQTDPAPAEDPAPTEIAPGDLGPEAVTPSVVTPPPAPAPAPPAAAPTAPAVPSQPPRQVVQSAVKATASTTTNTNSPTTTEQPAEDWQYQLIPYGWATGLGGDVTIRGVDAHVGYSYLDSGRYIDKTGGGRLEGWYQNGFGFLVDSNYLRSTALADSGELTATLKTTLLTTDAAIMGRLMQSDGESTVFADVKIGIRDIDEDGTLLLPNISYAQSRQWVTPLAGMTIGTRTGPFTFRLGGDFGGAGASYSTNLSASAELDFGAGLSFILSYRMLHIHDEQGLATTSFAHDLTLKGPSLGVGFAF